MSNGIYSGRVNTLFSTSIQDYSMDELLTLLGIDLSQMDNYIELKDKINTEVDKNIEIFTNLNNNNMVIFFEKIRVSLIGDDTLETGENITTSENTVIQTNTSYTLDYRREIDRLIVFDSLFRDNYSSTMSTNYISQLAETVKNVTKIKLQCLEFPSSYYNFVDSYESNYFWIKYGNNSDVSYAYFYIEPGNYDSIIVIQKLQDFVDTQNLDISFTLDLNIDSETETLYGNNKLTISSSYTTFEINFDSKKLIETVDPSYNISHVVNTTTAQSYYTSSSIIDNNKRCGWMLGFKDLNYSGYSSYTGDSVVDLTTPKYAYLVVNDYNHSSNNTYYSTSSKHFVHNFTIARIPITYNPFTRHSVVSMSDFSMPRYYHGPVDLDKFQVQLLDEHQRIIELNGNDFSFTLEVTYIYIQPNSQIS